MSAVRMVQVAIHQVIDMIAVRHGLVATVGPVSVRLLMGGTTVVRSAFLWIRRGHFDLVVVYMVAVTVVQVAIVKIIGVAIVFHGGVPAVWAMLVAVGPRVLLVRLSHCSSLPQRDSVPRPRVH